ncbi:MAG: hypothetical protein HWN65_13980 [Candidatus Helarchaeota archaeon]|nr:hypothetical protein [Candidatus Helarchaeota archaeon]
MPRKKHFVLLLVLFGLFLSLPSARADYPYATNSMWADIPPTIDGQLDDIYLNYGPAIVWYITPTSPHIAGFNYIYLLNDAELLYVYIDLLSDNTSETEDMVLFRLDTDNGEESADTYFYHNREMDLGSTPPGLDFTHAYEFSTSPNGNYNHVKWEIQLNLSSMAYNPGPGDVIGYLFAIYIPFAPQYYYPSNDYSTLSPSDESTYNKLRLASEPEPDFTTIIWCIILSISVISAIILTYYLTKRNLLFK